MTAEQISPVPRPCFVSKYPITEVLNFKYFKAAGILYNHIVNFHPFRLEMSLNGRRLGDFKLSVYFALSCNGTLGPVFWGN